MRVVYCVSYFRNFTGGQRSLAQLVRNLPPSVEALVLFPSEGSVPDAMRALGLPVVVLPAPSGLNAFEQSLLSSSRAAKLRHARDYVRYSLEVCRTLRRHRPDLVHCNETRSLFLFGLGARLARLPVVWHVRGGTLLGGRPALRRAARRIATQTVTVCEALRQELDDDVPIQVIYNGVSEPDEPEDAIHPAELRQFLAARGVARDDAFLLLTASSLVPYKGLHHLVEALSMLRRSPPLGSSVLFWVALGDTGSNEKRRYQASLRALAEGAGVDRDVLWAGWQEDATLWMRACDVVVLPSVAHERLRLPNGTPVEVTGSEGFPRTILEALSVGRPTIASRVAGVGEALTHEREGLLTPPGDPVALAEAIRRLVEDPVLRQRLGANARARARAFSVEATVDATVGLYNAVLARRA